MLGATITAASGAGGRPRERPVMLLLTGVTHDSRRVLAGDLYVALPGSRHHGAEFSGDAAAAGAVAVLTDATGSRAAAAAGLPALVVADPRARLGERGVLGVREPVRPAAAHRRHGDERQDHNHLLPGGCAENGRSPDGAHRRRADQGRRRGDGKYPDHPGGPGSAGVARGDGRAGRDGRGDGGLQPRSRPRPRGRDVLRRGGVHQPVPGPPGLPRGHRRLLRRQGAAVHTGVHPDRRRQRRRQVRQDAGRIRARFP